MCAWSRRTCLVATLLLPFGVAVAEPTTLPPPLYVHLENEDDLAAALAAVVLSDLDPDTRAEAVYSLGDLGVELTLPVLESAVVDTDRRVRMAAVGVAADMGSDGSAWVLAVVLDDDRVELREEAVYALAEIGGEVAVELLLRALADETDSVRESATQVLEELTPGSRD